MSQKSGESETARDPREIDWEDRFGRATGNGIEYFPLEKTPTPAPEPRTWTKAELELCMSWLDPQNAGVTNERLYEFLDFIESFERGKAPR